MRIQKYIADCGVCSRRAAEELVQNGKVLVNAKPATIGMEIDPENDRVLCNGKRIYIKICDKQYFIFNKPRGVISTMKSQNKEDDRSIVADMIKGIKGRVFPVGRLDRDSEGLMILTDDGELANHLTHPSHHVPKTYRTTVRGEVSRKQLDTLRSGVTLDDGETTQPAEVLVHLDTNTLDDNLKKTGKTVLHITITEGKNRQIRRMCEALNLEIMLLKRIGIATVKIGSLDVGAYRPMTIKEIGELFKALGMEKPIPKEKRNAKLAAGKNVMKDNLNEQKNQRYKKRTAEKSVYEKRFNRQAKKLLDGNKK